MEWHGYLEVIFCVLHRAASQIWRSSCLEGSIYKFLNKVYKNVREYFVSRDLSRVSQIRLV
jgi:hypothetical protein